MNIRHYLILILLFSSLGINAETIQQYYSTAQGKTRTELKNALHAKISVQTVLSYSAVWNALKTTDEDPNNSNNVILLYTGWSYPKNNNGGGTSEWNREHTWAKSLGNFGTSRGPGTDIHHLRPTDVTVNSKRGNLYFDNGGTNYTDRSRYGGGSGVTGCKYDGNSWEPRDEVKGDVARMLFYMAVRYEASDMVDLELAENSSSSGLHGKLSTLLQWHEEDPVDQWEKDRNEKIYNIQHNRNPFIDHPEYVDLIWGSGIIGNGGGSSEPKDIFVEDFESRNLGKMTAHNIVGYNRNWYSSSHGGNYFAKMSGYKNGSNTKNEDWLINTTAINLRGYTNLKLSFTTEMKVYGGNTTLKVFISKNYNGRSNPNSYSWTDITNRANYSTGGYNKVASGDIDLSAWANQSIYIAFKFENTTSGSNTWQLDNIKVEGREITTRIATAQPNNSFKNFTISPNPATNTIHINSDSNQDVNEVRLFNQSGQTKLVLSTYEYNNPIYINELKKGLYFIQITHKNGDKITEKLVIR